MSKDSVTRRQIIKNASVVAAASAVGVSGCTEAQSGTCPMAAKTCNTSFYKADGSFDPKAAKEAYFKMFNALGYPIPDTLKTDQFWVCDFVQGDFANLGMGGIFWINEKGTYGSAGTKSYKGDFKDAKYGYLGHEIYLLPGQTLPEHRHVGGPEGYGPKMESWLVRYGEVEFFGEEKGAGDEKLISSMPEPAHPWGYGEDWFKSDYIVKRTAKAGQIYTLKDPETWHGQRAGAQGAIVTEFGTYHNHVEFSKPGMIFDNTKAK